MKNLARADCLLATLAALFALTALAWGGAPAVTAAVPVHVKLDVTPAPASFADPANNPSQGAPFLASPRVGDGQQITLSATLLAPVNALPYPVLYKFTAVLSPSGQTFVIQNYGQSPQVAWSPPKGGDYKFTVIARKGSAQGSDSIENFHVRPSSTLPVVLSTNPPIKAVSGGFAVRAQVAGPAARRHEFWFSYGLRFPETAPPSWGGPAIASTGPHPAVTHPNLPPGLYTIYVYARTFANNVLVAEGFAQSQGDFPYFYRGHYVVLFPPGDCPPATTPADPTQAFSWTKPVTAENVSSLSSPLNGQGPLPVGAQAGADCTIEGYSVNDIANLEQLRVRKLNVSCANCHHEMMALPVVTPPDPPVPAWKDFLCQNLWYFPHADSYPDVGDQAEDTLFQLFTNWWSRGCPG